MKQKEAIGKFQKLMDQEGDTISRLLSFASHQVAKESLQSFNASGKIQLSAPQFNLLQMLCLTGINSKSLAARLNVTKQAVSQTLAELEAMGLVKKEIDPEDSRAKLVKHTDKGYALVSSLMESALEMEKRYSDVVGAKNYQVLKQALAKIVEE